MEKAQKNNKEFIFPEENLLHKRRPSAAADIHSPSPSEDDEVVSYEVSKKKFILFSSNSL